MAANQAQKHSSQKRSTQENVSTHRQASAREDVENEAGGYTTQVASQIRDLTSEHTGTALLLALGAGLGVGLLIGTALRTPPRRQRSLRERLLAEGLGQRLLERAENMLPDVLSERLGLR
jgi:hypothetical protein